MTEAVQHGGLALEGPETKGSLRWRRKLIGWADRAT